MSNSHLFLKSGFIRTPSQNGVGRYVCQLQRVVLKFCKNNGSSQGVRDFIESELMDFAKNNPGVVVYLKPRRHKSPIISAEFLNGDRQWISCRNNSRDEVLKWMNLLRTQSKDTTGFRFRKLIHTDHPSIQGPWTPYTFKNPSENLAEYPNKDLGQPEHLPITSTDQLLEIFNKKCDIDNSRAE